MANETSTRLKAPAEPPASEELEKETPAVVKATVSKWKPFIDKKGLPKDAVLDKKGKIVKPGTSQYATITALNGTVKLVAYFRNGKGVGRRLVKVLKPQKKNSRGAKDRAFVKDLRKSGVLDTVAL